MTGFEPQISGIGSDRSTNWATTIAHDHKSLISKKSTTPLPYLWYEG